MAFQIVRSSTANPGSGTSYTLYTVPAGSTLLISGMAIGLYDPSAAAGQMTGLQMVWNSAGNILYVEAFGVQSFSRDFTKDIPIAGGTAIDVLGIFAGTAAALIASLYGSLV